MPATAAARRTSSAATARARAAAPARAPVRTAPRSPARAPRRAPARRAAPRPRRSQATPIPGRLVAVGVGRTAGAVGGLADSGLVVRLTRGRLWIGVLAALLVGIVALNVIALGLNASSSRVAQQVDGLHRANSTLRARIASGLSSENVQDAASRLGFVNPEPGAVRYLRSHSGDIATAARRLASGELTGADAPTAAPPPVVAPADTATTDPATVATDPAATVPTTTAAPPTAAPTTTPTAGTTSTSGAAAAGGVSAP